MNAPRYYVGRNVEEAKRFSELARAEYAEARRIRDVDMPNAQSDDEKRAVYYKFHAAMRDAAFHYELFQRDRQAVLSAYRHSRARGEEPQTIHGVD